MKIYNNCIAYSTGINKPHTLYISNEPVNIQYMNNLNYHSIVRYIIMNSYKPLAIAYDNQNRKYLILQNEQYAIAIKNDIVKPLSIPEMIKKYNLSITEQEYKKLFSIN